MATIATMNVKVGADISVFKRNMQRVQSRVSSVAATFKRFRIPILAAAGALGLAAAQAIRTGDQFDKMSKRTGESVENLSRLAFAADLAGADINVLEKGLRALTERAVDFSKGQGEAADAFRDLGLRVTQTNGAMKSGATLILEISDALSTVTNDTDRAALAMELFGMRAGPQLLPLLREGRQGIQEMLDEADRLNITMSTKQAAAAAEMQDNLTRLGGMLRGFINDALSPVLQHINFIVGGFRLMASQGQETSKQLVKAFGSGSEVSQAFIELRRQFAIGLLSPEAQARLRAAIRARKRLEAPGEPTEKGVGIGFGAGTQLKGIAAAAEARAIAAQTRAQRGGAIFGRFGTFQAGGRRFGGKPITETFFELQAAMIKLTASTTTLQDVNIELALALENKFLTSLNLFATGISNATAGLNRFLSALGIGPSSALGRIVGAITGLAQFATGVSILRALAKPTRGSPILSKPTRFGRNGGTTDITLEIDGEILTRKIAPRLSRELQRRGA